MSFWSTLSTVLHQDLHYLDFFWTEVVIEPYKIVSCFEKDEKAFEYMLQSPLILFENLKCMWQISTEQAARDPMTYFNLRLVCVYLILIFELL